MRFPLAWADVASQNVALRLALIILSLSLMTLSVCSVKLALRTPLIIDRGCVSQAIFPSSIDRSESEIEVFLRLAIPMRFDSAVRVTPGFLSQDEELGKVSELKELANRQMTQKLIVNAVLFKGNAVMVDTDRLISVGTIRSVFPFPLTVTLASVARTPENPYGLLIEKVSPLKKEGEQ